MHAYLQSGAYRHYAVVLATPTRHGAQQGVRRVPPSRWRAV